MTLLSHGHRKITHFLSIHRGHSPCWVHRYSCNLSFPFLAVYNSPRESQTRQQNYTSTYFHLAGMTQANWMESILSGIITI